MQNPARKGAGNPGLDEKADYSKEQQQQFEGTPGASMPPVTAPQLTHRMKRVAALVVLSLAVSCPAERLTLFL